MKRILVVDDDQDLLEVLKYNLVKDGYNVITADDGSKAIEMARSEKPDLIILDLMLPGIDGFDVCRILRKELTVPILMLTAKNQEIDKVVGLEVGADDYVTKPFSVRELIARIRALLRRSERVQQPLTQSSDQEQISTIIKAGCIEINTLGHEVFVDGSELKLTPKEFDLLLFLVNHRGQVFDREKLVEEIWGYDYEGTARTVDVHMRSLRRKIERNPENPVSLVTVHGLGYKFEP